MRRAKLHVAGMDGNRTHPGRLSSAPQTVLKTACLPSMDVRLVGCHLGCQGRGSDLAAMTRPMSWWLR
jgi:hypothetical protein